MQRIPVIFDNDAGNDIDDLWALAIILAHPGLDLLACTTVSGDTQARARLVAKMLRLAGREEVPVYAGIGPSQSESAAGSLSRKRGLTHGCFVDAHDPEHDHDYPDAIEAMLCLLRDAAQPITIIATGNLTNIAAVLRRADERQRANTACLAIMGGELHWQHRESNIAQDAEAAHEVFQQPLPTFLATWSVSRELFFTMDEVHELLDGHAHPFMAGLLTCTKLWWGTGMRLKPGPVCYDIVPVFWAAGENEHIRCIRVDDLPVELDGALTRGMTVLSPWVRLQAQAVSTCSVDYIAASDRIDAAHYKRRCRELLLSAWPADWTSS